jgi:Cell division protein
MTTIRPTATPRGPRRWLQDHLRALDATTARLRRRPLATLLTLAMVGLTLALPTALVALGGALTAGGQTLGSEALQAALFLHRSVDESTARALEHRIAGERGVRAVRYISAAEGLKELRGESGLSQAVDHLDHNPLPATLVVQFDPSQPQAVVQQRFHTLAKLPEVAQARMDPHWMTRLYALLGLLRRAALVLAVALSATVLIVLGNTVRLELESHREEMEVLALLGATRAYLMRPYLYLGALFGLPGPCSRCCWWPARGSRCVRQSPQSPAPTSSGGTACRVLASGHRCCCW